MIQIAALDDQKEWLDIEEEITRIYFENNGEKYKFDRYNNVEWFLADLEEGQTFDIYLLDVELPESSGLKVARKIKQKYPEAKIVYITGHIEYAPEAFETNAYRYIPKKASGEKITRGVCFFEENVGDGRRSLLFYSDKFPFGKD